MRAALTGAEKCAKSAITGERVCECMPRMTNLTTGERTEGESLPSLLPRLVVRFLKIFGLGLDPLEAFVDFVSPSPEVRRLFELPLRLFV